MGVKRRRLESGDVDDLAPTGSQFAFRVSTSSVGDVEFTADQDGSGKWVKLTNVAKHVRIIHSRSLLNKIEEALTARVFLTIRPGRKYWELDLETPI